MKNVYNLITTAFESINEPDYETDYNITVEYVVHTGIRSYEITILPLDTTRSEKAFIQLFLNRYNCLIDVEHTNDLFTYHAWRVFCDVFEEQIIFVPQIERIIQSLE